MEVIIIGPSDIRHRGPVKTSPRIHGDLLSLRLTHICTRRHAYRRCNTSLIILKRKSRTEIWGGNGGETVSRDEMFIRAAPVTLCAAVSSSMHMNVHIHLESCTTSLLHRDAVYVRRWHLIINDFSINSFVECWAWLVTRLAGLAQSSAKSIRVSALWLLTAVLWQILCIITKPFNPCGHCSCGFCQPWAGKVPGVIIEIVDEQLAATGEKNPVTFLLQDQYLEPLEYPLTSPLLFQLYLCLSRSLGL